MHFATAMVGHIVVMLSAIAMLLVGILHRVGTLDTGTAISIFRYAAWANAGAFVLCVAGAAWLIGVRKRRGLVPAILGVVIGGALCTVSLYWKYRADHAPRIHDISTDTDHPPEFVAIAEIRKNVPNGVQYEGAAA